MYLINSLYIHKDQHQISFHHARIITEFQKDRQFKKKVDILTNK